MGEWNQLHKGAAGEKGGKESATQGNSRSNGGRRHKAGRAAATKRGRVGCGGRSSGGAGDGGGGGRGAGEAAAGGAVAGLDARGGGVFIVGERAAVLLRVSRPARAAGKVECHVGDGTSSVEVSAVNEARWCGRRC